MAIAAFDIVVVGGGIVGVATAHALVGAGRSRVLVIEAEPALARHQSGRNSGVIHSGLYYPAGSTKARLCSAGRQRLYAFCEDHDIAHRRCGKLVVAADETQLSALTVLEQRGADNGLAGIEPLDSGQMRQYEPAVAGIAGLWIPQTGVVDFAQVTSTLADQIRQHGGELLLDSRVGQIRRESHQIRVQTPRHEVRCDLLINCAGLQADRVARLSGVEPGIRLIPFRGEYFRLADTSADRVRSLIYPVPDPRYPFLGVHLTRTIDDQVIAGPNAVPAFKREGYRRTDFSLRDVADTLAYPGFWRLARGYWRTGMAETRRSLSRQAFADSIEQLVPSLRRKDLLPYPSGVRAQAVDSSGKLLDDFHILQEDGMIHVLNAPSPAATAALAIGDHIAALANRVA